jgi:hypothetical protein
VAVDTWEVLEGVGDVTSGKRGADVGTEMERDPGAAWDDGDGGLGLCPSNLEISSLPVWMGTTTGA